MKKEINKGMKLYEIFVENILGNTKIMTPRTNVLEVLGYLGDIKNREFIGIALKELSENFENDYGLRVEEGKLVKETKEEIVAHSETGHHHIVKSKTPFGIYTLNGKTYLGTIEDSMLVHEKTGADVHSPHKLAPAFYEIIIKKSFNYYTKMMERVKD